MPLSVSIASNRSSAKTATEKRRDMRTYAAKTASKKSQNMQTSTSTSKSVSINKRPQVLHESTIRTIVSEATSDMRIGSLEELDLSDSDPSGQSTSSLLETELIPVPDFFDEFGVIPNITDISVGEDLPLLVEQSISKFSEQRSSLQGYFADPLTGAIYEEVEEEEDEELQEEESISIEEEQSESVEDDELLVLLEMEIEAEPAKQIMDDEHEFEKVFTVEMEMERETEEEIQIDYKALERLENLRQITTITATFLDQLIENVVQKCEYTDPEVMLRRQMDKQKLINNIITLLEDLEFEQRMRTFLNRKAVEHYRRKGYFSAISEEQAATMQTEMEKLKQTKHKLDLLLGREEELSGVMKAKIEDGELKLLNIQTMAKEKEQTLEHLIRETFDYEHLEKMQPLVSKSIRQLSAMHKEISSVRLTLIQKQHKFATLSEEIDKLEHIDEGLTLHDYGTLQTEIQALGKKDEERNNELNRCRTRCHMDIHILSHLKDSEKMLLSRIAIQKETLAQLLQERLEFRTHLYKLKSTRSEVLREIRELSFQCGLLDKPALMLDYDATEERVVATREKINEMRTQYNGMMRKIHHFENRLHARNL